MLASGVIFEMDLDLFSGGTRGVWLAPRALDVGFVLEILWAAVGKILQQKSRTDLMHLLMLLFQPFIHLCPDVLVARKLPQLVWCVCPRPAPNPMIPAPMK